MDYAVGLLVQVYINLPLPHLPGFVSVLKTNLVALLIS